MTHDGVDAKGRPLRNLSLRQKTAIELLACGETPDRIALVLHVRPSLIRRWLEADHLFRVSLAGRRAVSSPPDIDLGEMFIRRFEARLGESSQGWEAEHAKEHDDE